MNYGNMASRRTFLTLVGVGGVTLLMPMAGAFATKSRLIKIYKSPYCGCCSQWTKILQKSGYDTKVIKMDDVSPIKKMARLPADFASCHTAIIDGYVVEGHVPVEAIEKMLAERPKIAGIAVPGMIDGTPGMPGPNAQPYNVVAYTRDGKKTVYMTFP